MDTFYNDFIFSTFIITAIASTIGAYYLWTLGRQHVIVEAIQIINATPGGTPELTLSVMLYNRRHTSIQPWFLEVRGLPAAEVSETSSVSKDMYNRSFEAPFPDNHILPFEAIETTFKVNLNWQDAHATLADTASEIRWQALVTFYDRRRPTKRWSRQLNLILHRAELDRLMTVGAPSVERRKPGRPFSQKAKL